MDYQEQLEGDRDLGPGFCGVPRTAEGREVMRVEDTTIKTGERKVGDTTIKTIGTTEERGRVATRAPL